ncbi:2-phosphosulfolactate phosphatase [Nocardioides sp. GCM10027113]|uniref:2-phosphosulfolactate phosphatase n=1 Tax=unclassified Nocardioides TaxID=2615069 RepID=UPI003613F7D1
MSDPFSQAAFDVRFDWGPVGAAAARADVSVVVDVLSFSTSVCVAVERGMRVYPYRWRDEGAEAFARAHDAVLAVGRLEAGRGGPTAPVPSLSPAGLLECAPVARLVLPSPNGSTIAAALQRSGAEVAVGCLRNAGAVAAWLAPALEAGRSVAVVAAGERWHQDDSLRPALEDQLGGGAVIRSLARLVPGAAISPEARAAADLFAAARKDLEARLHACASGRELAAQGFAADVTAASALDASPVVPVLADDGGFLPSS